MAVISNLDILLRAKIDKLDGDFLSAKGKARNFKKEIDSDLGKVTEIAKRSNPFADSLGKQLEGAFSLGTIIPAITAAGLAFGGIELGAKAATAAITGIRDAMNAIDDTTDAAHRLGTSYADLVILRRSLGETSGLGAEAIDAAIQRMEMGIAEAATGSGAVYDILTKMGIDSGKLMRDGPVEQMRVLMAATKNLQNPTDQLKVAYELFGKQGAALVASLREGPGHLDDTARRAVALGSALSDAQAEQVGAAKDAWARIQDIGTGAMSQIAAEVSPALTVVARYTEAIASVFGLVKTDIGAIIDGSLFAVGAIHDTLNSLFTGAEAPKMGTGFEMWKQAQAARKEAEDAAKAARATRGTDSQLAGIDKEKEAAKEAANEAKRLDEEKKKRIKDRITHLKDEIDLMSQAQRLEFGGVTKEKASSLAKDMLELKKTREDGGLEAQIVEMQKLQAMQQELNDRRKAMDDGKALKDSLMKPEEQFRKQMLDDRKLFSRGAIDAETFGRSIKASMEKLIPAGRSDQTLLTANSREGWKFLQDMQTAQRDKQLAKMEEQRILQQQLLIVAQEQKDAMKGIKTVGRAR